MASYVITGEAHLPDDTSPLPGAWYISLASGYALEVGGFRASTQRVTPSPTDPSMVSVTLPETVGDDYYLAYFQSADRSVRLPASGVYTFTLTTDTTWDTIITTPTVPPITPTMVAQAEAAATAAATSETNAATSATEAAASAQLAHDISNIDTSDDVISEVLADDTSEARGVLSTAYVAITTAGGDVWGLFGQSNTVGFGEGIDSTYLDTPDSRILQWPASGSYVGQPVAAFDPLLHVEPASARVGFAMTFGKDILRDMAPARTILLAPGAHGSTGFAVSNGYTWDHTDETEGVINLARLAMAQTIAAVAAAPGNRFAGILMIMGENDSNYLTQSQYADQLDAFIEYFAAQFGDDWDFLLGQMNPDELADPPNAGYPGINAATIDTPRRKTRTGFAYGTPGHHNDVAGGGTIHYDAVGQRLMGHALADALTRSRANVTGVAPLTVTGLALTQDGTTLTASWDQPIGRVTDYVLTYAVNGGSATTLDRSNPNIDTSGVITGLTLGDSVEVSVATVNEQGTSAAASASLTLVTAPANLSGLTVGTVTGTSVALTWDASARATGYLVEHSADAGATYQSFGTVADTAAIVTGLQYASDYTLRVTPTNAAGDGTAATTTASTDAATILATDVGVTPAGAWGLRKLVDSYSGSAINVTYADATTADIGFKANGELDTATLLTGVAAHGDATVGTIYDQSGNGRNFAQSTVTSQPAITTGGAVIKVNAKPALKFAGSHYLLTSGTLGLYAASGATMLAVYTNLAVGASSAAAVFGETCSTTSARYLPAYWSPGSAPSWQIYNDTPSALSTKSGTAVAADGSLHQHTALDTDTALTERIDGASDSMDAAAYTRTGTVTLDRGILGAQKLGAGGVLAQFTGYVSELVVWTDALTQTEYQAGEQNQIVEFAL